jgi:hypothetical protein
LARKKVRTRRTPITIRDHLHVRAVDVHRVDLIATMSVARRLEDELFAVGREVGFCVLAAEGQLFDIAQVLFARKTELIVLGSSRRDAEENGGN